MSPLVAGLIAAAPLAVLGVTFILLNGHNFVQQLIAQDVGQGSDVSPNLMYWAMLGGMAVAPFVFGLLGGLVYSWIDNANRYMAIAFSAAAVLSIVALVAKPPVMRGFKIIANVSVALALGLLIPFLVGQ